MQWGLSNEIYIYNYTDFSIIIILINAMFLFLLFQKLMRKQDKSGQYFQTKRPSQLIQSSEPLNKVSK